MFKSFQKQKGFTLVEILVVIVIIGILFSVLLPRIDFASNKAREAGVKTDFKSFQTSAESYLREISGVNPTELGLNTYLDGAAKINSGVSILKDPWKSSYKMQMQTSNSKVLMVFRSTGPDKTSSSTTDLFHYTGTAPDLDDKILLIQYNNGSITSCTKGTGSDVGSMNITGAGTSLPAVTYDVSLSLRQPFESSYTHEYAIDSSIAYPYGYSYGINYATVRTYVYSNTPLLLSIISQSNKYESSLGYPVNVQYIKEANNNTYAGFQQWNMTWDWDYSVTFDVGYSSGPPSFTNGTLNDFSTDEGSQITAIRDISGQSQSPNTILGCN